MDRRAKPGDDAERDRIREAQGGLEPSPHGFWHSARASAIIGAMVPTVQMLLLLFVVIAAVAVVASRLRIPLSIPLVVTGVILALVPGLPAVDLVPELVLLLVLPPVIYSSAVAMSWREFKFNLRPISFLAVGCVIFTTVVVAAAMHFLLGMPWALGFVLGAIVSPPDAMAPLSVARRMRIPRRILVILEGEGLANDATALILYRFAVVAVSVGSFSLGEAATNFAIIVAAEIAWGLVVGWMMLRLRRWVRDPRIEITLSLITPFLAFWPPHDLGGSGVLATVVTGLYISWNGLLLISAATRLQGIFFWDFLIYLTEGMVFLITGLQLRGLLERISHFETAELVVSAVVVSAVVILSRFVWMYPATYVPRWVSASIRRKDPAPPWTWPFALAFTGIRGIVSLAAALAIPFTTAAGEPFPGRDLILFLTFTVILVTLVGQGLMLPTVMRWLGLANAGEKEHEAERIEEDNARREAVIAACERLETLAKERGLSDAFIAPIRTFHQDRVRHVENRTDGDESRRRLSALREDIELLLIAAERQRVNELYRQGKLKDEPRRRIERELDLREAHLANVRGEE
jgi:CPA1 family monovalent cation:H+ antiporter